MTAKGRSSLILAVTVLLALVACCAKGGAPLQAGAVAPDFRLSDLTGRTVFLNAELRRPIVLTFFATWCAPCREEIPVLIAFQRRLGDRAQILCVVADPENIDQVRSTAAGLSIPYPMLLDEGQRTMRAYGVRALPATFLIGRDGRIVSRFGVLGESEAGMLYDAIERISGNVHGR